MKKLKNGGFVVLDDGDMEDSTLYESIQDAKESVDNEDVAAQEVIIYELVPRFIYKKPAQGSWVPVK